MLFTGWHGSNMTDGVWLRESRVAQKFSWDWAISGQLQPTFEPISVDDFVLAATEIGPEASLLRAI